MRVFFDSSTIIAAIISHTGASRKLAELTKKGTLIGIVSQGILEEVFSKADKITASETEIVTFVEKHNFLVREKVRLDEVEKFTGITTDPKDLHVVAAAKLTKCQYLVTLDQKHLLASETKRKSLLLRIVSPKELLLKLTAFRSF